MDATLAAPVAPIAPIAPVAPTPVKEAQTGDDDTSAPSGFDQALKQELNALRPEEKPQKAAGEKKTDSATAETLDSAWIPGANETAAAQALASLAPIVQSSITLPAGEVSTSVAADQSSETPAVVSADVTDDPSIIESQASDEIGVTQSAPQLTAGQQNVWEQRGAAQSSTQPSAGQSNAVLPNVALKPNGHEENGGRHVDGAAPAKSAARTPQIAGTEYGVQAQLQAYEPERAAAVEAATNLSHAGVQLDTLSSTSLLTRWGAPQPAVGDASFAPASARIDTPIGAPGWADAFQQKIVWLVDRQQHSAELHVNPPHLGPVEIMLNIGEEGANIMLCSPHAAVREAIESSLPDLRASLAERGLSLGQAAVGSDSSAAREQFAEQVRNHINKPELPAQASLVVDVARLTPRGLVDIYA